MHVLPVIIVNGAIQAAPAEFVPRPEKKRLQNTKALFPVNAGQLQKEEQDVPEKHAQEVIAGSTGDNIRGRLQELFTIACPRPGTARKKYLLLLEKQFIFYANVVTPQTPLETGMKISWKKLLLTSIN